MRKTRSQTQAENGPSASTRSTRAAASSTKTTTSSSSSSTSSARERDQDKNENPFAAAAAAASPNPPLTNNQANRQTIELDPAKLKEYQDMIQTFRVVDLHKVLQFLSLSVAGRKHELQQRVLDLLKTNFELVSAKLREIYRTDYYSDRNVQYGPPDPKRMFSHMQMPTVQSTADVRSAMVSVGNVGNAGVGQNPGNGAGAVPANMGVPFQHNIGASMPIHPDVRLKKLAFYDVLATLIKPSSLLPRSNQRIQELPFYFTLTPQQATEIATNRDIRNGSKVEHSIQVQLRFCLLETSCEQEDCFPSNVIVKVNNKLCPLPNPIPTNRPNVEPKRPPRPVNVTSNVKLSPTVTNTITVQWCPDFSRGYCIAAYLVKKLTSSQLLHRMKTKGIKPADYTRGLIKEKLTEDADCEIATTMLKVSLNCPLGKMKMSIPCRASTCSHLQCFDANLYLQMNERKPTWNCPVCDKPAIYDHLVIDGYFQEVLASSLLGSEDTEIQLHKDGSWSTHNLRNETQLIDTPSKPVEKVELISDDIELITDDVKPLTKVPPPPVISNEPTSTTNSETVDLTLSDSDDDMPLAKRKTSAAKNATTSSAVSTSNGQRSATVQSSQSSKGVITSPKATETENCGGGGIIEASVEPNQQNSFLENFRKWREKRKQLLQLGVTRKNPSSSTTSPSPNSNASEEDHETSTQPVSVSSSIEDTRIPTESNFARDKENTNNVETSSASPIQTMDHGRNPLNSNSQSKQISLTDEEDNQISILKSPTKNCSHIRLKIQERIRKWKEKFNKSKSVSNTGPSIQAVTSIDSGIHSNENPIREQAQGLTLIQQKFLKISSEKHQNNALRNKPNQLVDAQILPISLSTSLPPLPPPLPSPPVPIPDPPPPSPPATSRESALIQRKPLKGSINHEKKSLKPQVCDISNKIRQYRKKCHTPSSFVSVIQQKEITSTSTSTKVNQSNINSTNQVEQSIGEKTMSLNYNRNNDAKDGNKTLDGDLNGGNSVACSNNETIEPISEILLPKKLTKKKSKSRKRSRSVQSTRDQSVVSFKRFLESFGSGCDINSISKSQRLKLRKMWARENQLQGTNNNNNNPFTRNNNFSTTVTSDYVQGPSTSTSSRSPEMAIPALMSLTVDPPFSQMERSVFTLDNLHMNSGLDRGWLDATLGNNNCSRTQLSSFNRIHRILCDTQKKSKSDSKVAKSLRDTPKGLKLNELLEYATVNLDTMSKLSTERKLMYQKKQPYARQLLQRCKQWRVLPPHLDEAFQRGLI